MCLATLSAAALVAVGITAAPSAATPTPEWQVLARGGGAWIFPAQKRTYALLVTKPSGLPGLGRFDPTWKRDALSRVDFNSDDILLVAAWATGEREVASIFRRGRVLRVTLRARYPSQASTSPNAFASYEFLAVPKRLVGHRSPARIVVRLQP